MKICLYVDEDSMDRNLVRALRSRRVDVITALDVEMIERSDQEQLDFATRNNRTLFSYNRSDFYHLHTNYLSLGKSRAGIILARQQSYSVGEQMRRILKLITTLSAEDMIDRVEFLSTWK